MGCVAWRALAWAEGGNGVVDNPALTHTSPPFADTPCPPRTHHPLRNPLT